MPATTTFAFSGDPHIDSLLGGVKWATLNLTYSFPGIASYYGTGYGYGEPDTNFGTLNAVQQSAARAIFAEISSVGNPTFVEVTESLTRHGDLRLAMSDAPSTAWAYFPTTAPEGGDMWLNKSRGYYDNPQKGNYAYTTFLHETGHALGLEHAHEDNIMPLARDSMEFTVMSYRSYVGASTTSGYTNEKWGYAQSLMMYDIAALQQMYGPNYSTNSGTTIYSWSPTTGEMFVDGIGQGAPGANRVFMTIWDGGGTDTYDLSRYTTGLKVDLSPGEWTTTSTEQLAKLHFDGSKVAVGNIANSLLYNNDTRSLIENARGGSGNDLITGNSAANLLLGGDGSDVMYGVLGDDLLGGGPGADTLYGGLGNDSLDGGEDDDILLGEAGNDHIVGDPGDDLSGGGPGADRLNGGLGNDGLDGGDGDDILFGDDGGDTLVGDGGADYLSGGRGADRMFGGAEGDVFDGGDSDDLIGGGAGWDLIRAGTGNDALDGGSGNDWLYGGAGNDVIDGDIGSDWLYGEEGSDTFRFRNADSAIDTVMDFQPLVDYIHVQTGRSLAEVINSSRTTDGGSTILEIGNETLVVVSGVMGIGEDWFV